MVFLYLTDFGQFGSVSGFIFSNIFMSRQKKSLPDNVRHGPHSLVNVFNLYISNSERCHPGNLLLVVGMDISVNLC